MQIPTYMTRKDNVNTVLIEKRFHFLPHAFKFLIVRGIAIIPWWMPGGYQPRGLGAVYLI